MAAQDIYLIRHAQSEWNAIGRWQGMADPPLSDLGLAQAERLAEVMPDVGATHLYCSTLQRARDTAAPLAARLGMRATEDPDLCELDVGSWEGKTRAEIGADDPAALEAFFRGEQGWTGGESYDEHEARAERIAERLRLLPDGSIAVCVTHGGTLRAIVLALLELDHGLRWKFTGIDHTAVTHLRNAPHGYRLRSFNAPAAGLHAGTS